MIKKRQKKNQKNKTKGFQIYGEFPDPPERLLAVTFVSCSFLSQYVHKRLDRTCLSLKICSSVVIVHGKIALGFTGESFFAKCHLWSPGKIGSRAGWM